MILFCALLLVGLTGCEHTLPEEACSPPDFVLFDKSPQIVKSVNPQYPEAARQAGLEGTVWVRILVNEKGKVAKVEIQQSSAEIFNQPSIAAAKQFIFTPAYFEGKPICVWVSLPFHFRL